MNVRELIEELSKLDPELPALTFDHDEGWSEVGSIRAGHAEFPIGFGADAIAQGSPVAFIYD